MDVFSTEADFHAMRLPSLALLSPEMRPDRVGERLTALRQHLGLSKAQFADAIGLDRSSLTKSEAGKRSLDIAVGARIADLYGVGLDFIYRGQMADVPLESRTALMAEIHAVRAARLFPDNPGTADD